MALDDQALLLNDIRDAVVAIEQELGIKPASVYANVRSRIDILENRIGFGLVNVISIIANYTIIDSDCLISVGTLSAPITITLPLTPSIGKQYIIKDSNASASINNILINGNGNNIDSSSTLLLTTNYISIKLIFNGSKWIIV